MCYGLDWIDACPPKQDRNRSYLSSSSMHNASVNAACNIIEPSHHEQILAGTRSRKQWAAPGGGRYFFVKDQERPSDSLEAALRVPYSVRDQGGALAGEAGSDELIELDQSFPRRLVATSPSRVCEEFEFLASETLCSRCLPRGESVQLILMSGTNVSA